MQKDTMVIEVGDCEAFIEVPVPARKHCDECGRLKQRIQRLEDANKSLLEANNLLLKTCGMPDDS